MFHLGWQQIFGLFAGGTIAVSYIPQIWKLFKLKSAREIYLVRYCSYAVA
jgi:uncharacterized protein with PQ loop repeat